MISETAKGRPIRKRDYTVLPLADEVLPSVPRVHDSVNGWGRLARSLDEANRAFEAVADTETQELDREVEKRLQALGSL